MNAEDWSALDDALTRAFERGETCDGTLRLTRLLLIALGYRHADLELALDEVRGRGGYCDCEVLMNATNAPVELAVAVKEKRNGSRRERGDDDT